MNFNAFFTELVSAGILQRGLIGLTLSVVFGLAFGAFIGWATGRSRSESAVLLALATSLVSIGAGFTDGAIPAPIGATLVATVEVVFALIVPILLLRYVPVLWAWLSMLVVPVTTITFGILAASGAVKQPVNPVVVDPKLVESYDAGPLPAVVQMTCTDFKTLEESPYTGGDGLWCPPDGTGVPALPACPGDYVAMPVLSKCFASEANIPRPMTDESGPEAPCVCVTGTGKRTANGACTWNHPARAAQGYDGVPVACICPDGYDHAENWSGAPCKAIGDAPIPADGPVPPNAAGGSR